MMIALLSKRFENIDLCVTLHCPQLSRSKPARVQMYSVHYVYQNYVFYSDFR